MTRRECETQIAKKLHEIHEILNNYEDDIYLSIAIFENTISFNNDYWFDDDGKPEGNNCYTPLQYHEVLFDE